MSDIDIITAPGEVLGLTSDFLSSSSGTYEAGGRIISTLAGEVIYGVADGDGIRPVTVIAWNDTCSTDSVVSVGSEVIGQVTRIMTNQATVDIIAVENKILKQPTRGSIRREDARQTETDSLVMHNCFRPGDIVRASVISLGDARQYFLSTSQNEHGVLRAKSEDTGNVLIPISLQVLSEMLLFQIL